MAFDSAAVDQVVRCPRRGPFLPGFRSCCEVIEQERLDRCQFGLKSAQQPSSKARISLGVFAAPALDYD